MKKVALFSTSLLMLVGAVAPLSQMNSVYAATSKDTTAEITYEKGDLVIDPTDPEPVDPTDPTDPTDPIDPTDPAWGAGLPDNLNFGKDKVGKDVKEYWTLKEGATVEHALIGDAKAEDAKTMSDQRLRSSLVVQDYTGTNEGWHVTLQQAEQFKAGDKELTGAQMSLWGGRVGYNAGEGIKAKAISNTPLMKKKVAVAVSDTPQTVLGAQKGEGAGQTSEIIEGFSLNVPGGVMNVGHYTTQLNWVLQAGPSK